MKTYKEYLEQVAKQGQASDGDEVKTKVDNSDTKYNSKVKKRGKWSKIKFRNVKKKEDLNR